MLVPNIYRRKDLFDDLFDNMFRDEKPAFPFAGSQLMKTDIKETETAYILDVELPGVNKEDLTVELKDGALEIKATTKSETNDENEKSRYIRRERFYGSCSRSFFVGEDVTQEDIKAKFADGVLTLTVPKVQPKPQIETKQLINIE